MVVVLLFFRAPVLHHSWQQLQYAVVQILVVSQKVHGVSVQMFLPSTNMFVNVIPHGALALAVE